MTGGRRDANLACRIPRDTIFARLSPRVYLVLIPTLAGISPRSATMSRVLRGGFLAFLDHGNMDEEKKSALPQSHEAIDFKSLKMPASNKFLVLR